MYHYNSDKAVQCFIYLFYKILMFVVIVQHDSPTVHITATAVVNLLLSQRMTL